MITGRWEVCWAGRECNGLAARRAATTRDNARDWLPTSHIG